MFPSVTHASNHIEQIVFVRHQKSNTWLRTVCVSSSCGKGSGSIPRRDIVARPENASPFHGWLMPALFPKPHSQCVTPTAVSVVPVSTGGLNRCSHQNVHWQGFRHKVLAMDGWPVSVSRFRPGSRRSTPRTFAVKSALPVQIWAHPVFVLGQALTGNAGSQVEQPRYFSTSGQRRQKRHLL